MHAIYWARISSYVYNLQGFSMRKKSGVARPLILLNANYLT